MLTNLPALVFPSAGLVPSTGSPVCALNLCTVCTLLFYRDKTE